MKSWKTTLLGIACFALAAWAFGDNLHRNATALRYQIPVIALIATGLMGIFSRDHSHKG